MIGAVLDLGWRHRLPVVLQTEAAECGLACLAMVTSYHGHRIDLNTLRRRHPVSLSGVTLRGLIQVASHLNLSGRALRFEIDQLRKLRLPAIVHWDMNHFVVLRAVKSRDIVVHDPALGERRISLTEASKHLTGVALELTPAEGFVHQDERRQLPFSVFWGQLRGLGHPMLQVLVLAVVLEVMVVVAPFYMQLVMDEVIARGDADLLMVLAIGFGLLTLISVATAALRSHVVLVVQNTVHFQIGARLFHHLLRLPLAWFEKRHIGDVMSRFGSIEPIRNLLAEGLIVGLLDGVMAVATLVMIFVYSPQLAAVVVCAVLLYTLLRVGLFRMLRNRSEIAIQAEAKEHSSFIETIRATQSIKLFNRESEREGQWLNRFADVVNAHVRLGRAQITFRTLNGLIFGIENIVVVYLAARLALSNTLSIGMIFAFMSYKANFSDKTAALVERLIDIRLIGLHLERIGDIALSSPERGHDQVLTYMRQVRGGIELRNVCFRYAESEPFVLDNVSLKVEPGRFVTITGPSGGGKTTLIKIMLGLLEPTSGEVLIDGIPLPTIGVRAYREQIAAVMQDDQLLSGSVADNICFFDSDFDHERMIRSAEMAAIHDEIMTMPMAYNSLIGDMGSSLSGGQKQRVLLARALYRQPKILFLDEGTAHLDVENEKQINVNLRQLDITRISVAHRPDIANGADDILRIGRTAQH